jgi:hypothetical protein
MWRVLKSAVRRMRGSNPWNDARVTHYRLSNPYHAVSIIPGPGACPTARELRHRRFLSEDAPPLPLSTGGRESCGCAYKHYDDRRLSRRRRSDRLGTPQSTWQGPERRGMGRRATDASPSA